MHFDPLAFDLPIVDILDQVKSSLAEESTLIVHAPPGAGKSTLLPLVLMQEDWLEGQKIIMLEPRRLAAKSSLVPAPISTTSAVTPADPVAQLYGSM